MHKHLVEFENGKKSWKWQMWNVRSISFPMFEMILLQNICIHLVFRRKWHESPAQKFWILMLFLMPIHSTSSMNSVFALTAMSSSSSSWLRTRPLSEEFESRRRACSWATESLISLTWGWRGNDGIESQGQISQTQ